MNPILTLVGSLGQEQISWPSPETKGLVLVLSRGPMMMMSQGTGTNDVIKHETLSINHSH